MYLLSTAGTPPPSPLRIYGTYSSSFFFFLSGETGSAFSHSSTRIEIVNTRGFAGCHESDSRYYVTSKYMVYPWWVYIYIHLVGYCNSCFALRQCDVHVPVRHKIKNPLIPQHAGVIPMATGSHHQGLVLRYIERAASAANPCIHTKYSGLRKGFSAPTADRPQS